RRAARLHAVEPTVGLDGVIVDDSADAPAGAVVDQAERPPRHEEVDTALVLVLWAEDADLAGHAVLVYPSDAHALAAHLRVEADGGGWRRARSLLGDAITTQERGHVAELTELTE